MTTGLSMTLLKYGFSTLFAFISIACAKNVKYTISSLLELACIFLTVNTLPAAAKIPALVLPAAIAADIIFLVICGVQYSPTFGLYDLVRTVVVNIRRTKLVHRLPDAKENSQKIISTIKNGQIRNLTKIEASARTCPHGLFFCESSSGKPLKAASA